MSLHDHLQTGTTTIARAFALTRKDGVVMGFTDHDCDLSFDNIHFAAATGLDAGALEQMTGLAVDNAEVAGALSAASLSETDILAGRYDGAGITIWRLNWAEPAQRDVLFRGTLGEITRAGGAFRAELRGLSEALNQSGGRVFHASCGAVLGDAACGVDLAATSFQMDLPVLSVAGAELTFDLLDRPEGWFSHGTLSVLSGAVQGLVAMIRDDRTIPATQTLPARRQITLWAALTLPLVAGDMLRLQAGCDKQAVSCRLKFNNYMNFRGFPHMPGEDWLQSYPKAGQPNKGGRRG